MTDKNDTLSLATGSPLTQQTWDDFVERLRYHVDGEGVNEHCTAFPVFVVKNKEMFLARESNGDDIYLHEKKGELWQSCTEYYNSLDEEQRYKVDDEIENIAFETFSVSSLSKEEMEDLLCEVFHYELIAVGREYRYIPISFHFTREAAEAFIRRKAHDYDELSITVESSLHCWEFNTIREAILKGKLVFKED